MGLKGKLAALKKSMHGELDFFDLADGSRYYFDPNEKFFITFKFFTDCLHAEHKRETYPEPPELIKKVADAKDRCEALSRVMGETSHLPLDAEALIVRGELVPRCLRAEPKEETL